MNSNYTTVVGMAIAILLCSLPAFSQTTIFNCSPDPVSLCVTDPGVSLPDNNQMLIGEGTPGASSCGVHLRQSRTIETNCPGTVVFSVAILVEDTVLYTFQDITHVVIDSIGQSVITFDTRNVDDATIRTNGLPYNAGSSDHYRIRWHVDDECGGEDVCEEFVQLYDCQAPNVIADSGKIYTATVSLGCTLRLTASDYFYEATDDCTNNAEWVFSLDEFYFRPDSLFDPCSIPAYGVELPFDFWIADKGIDANCNDSIEYFERNRYKQTVAIVFVDYGGPCLHCLYKNDYVRGTVSTKDDRPIELVAVTMTSPGHGYPTYVTADNGEFRFNDVVTPQDVTITANRNDNHRNGVSTIDLVKIQKHLLGIEPITNPYTIIAMDANNSQNESAIDIVEIRKLILGIYSEFPHNQSWRFIDKKFDFNDPSYPWPNPSAITLSLTGSVDDADFIGIKIGDVNNSVIPNFQQPFLPRSPKPKVWLETNEQSFKAGELIDVPIALKSYSDLLGFQFTLSSADLEFISVRSASVHLQANECNLADDVLTMSWFTIDPIKIEPGDELFTVQARARRSGSLRTSLRISSDITEAELYDAAETVYEPVLSIQSFDTGVTLLPLLPNPATDHVLVPFYLPEGTTATIQFTSSDNKLVFSRDVTGHAGRNEITVPCSHLGSGMLICTMQSEAGISAQKVMVVR